MLKVYHQYSQLIDFKNLPNPDDVWTLQDLVGEGTYGEVYLAKHKETGQEAAVKILESIHEVVEEIEEEYLVFRDLSQHPNIPDFYGLFLKPVDLAEDQLWIAMELCGGGSVTDLSRELQKQGSKLDETLIAHILKQTLLVLRYLHDNNVMHRDVKGNNILLTDKGKVKLLDFGVSGHLEEKLGRRKTHVGTPYWMAPEVIACENQLEYNYDVRCDIWSLGVTAIELADGHPPLADVDPRRALFKIPRNPPPTVKNPSDWSEEFLDFVKSCLVKDFEVRPFTEDLLKHRFITQLQDEDIPELEEALISLTVKMERTVTAPDVTTKHGQFKSGKKAKKEVYETSDLAKLENLDEDTIVSQLLNRYIQDMIYTYIGDILLALNPFTPMPIYTEEYSRQYMNASKDDNPPHIYAVADQAYQLMMHNKTNQCIVISGESGAGKTESANLLVQQLTQLGKAPNRTLEERILQVNPLMEAFGNAKTVINDNSSRFGKYLEMFFTPSGTVIGAKITEYLLEKSRVIYQAKDEQNFHIFYYVHDSLISGENTESYHLGDSKHYRYIHEHTSKSPDISTLSANRVKFKAIRHCFEIIGFQQEEVKDVYSILAAILHTGNIEFTVKEANGEDQCIVNDEQLIQTISKLLGIDKQELIETLTTTGMVAKGEIIIKRNSIQEAVNARDAMAKALYGRLFSWIVNRISSLLKPLKSQTSDNDGLVIGLLDIFGFENFQKNSFEQVCINIANEQIQYYFNQHIFAWEMQEYSNEGIDGTKITFVDNRPILDMFLMKPIGLLALLDEESHFPKATDQTLVEKFHHNIKSNVYSRPKADNLLFSIEHYAGQVMYDAYGFLEKNRDRLSVEIVNVLRSSENNVVKSLFLTPLTKTGNLQYGSLSSSKSSSESSSLPSPVANGGIFVQSYSASRTTASLGGSRIYSALVSIGLTKYHPSSDSYDKFPPVIYPGLPLCLHASHLTRNYLTVQLYSSHQNHASASASMTRIQQTVATYFRYSLMDLLAKMVTGTPHFVRCIKPNDEKDPGHFDSTKVMTQLRYTGVLETTRIRRQGYSHRVLFSDFIKRYQMLAFSWNEHPAYNKESCRILLERLGLEDWELGKSKVFLKYYHSEQISRLYEKQNRSIIIVQAYVRMFLARTRFYKLKWKREKAALKIQTCFRGFKERKKFGVERCQRKEAALNIQKVIRGYLTRKSIRPKLEDRRQASIAIQSAIRTYLVRKKCKQSSDEESARKIQRMYRLHRAQQTAKHLRQERLEHRSARSIQSFFRMWRCKAIYQKLLDSQSKQDLELLYFTQQVENYSNDQYKEQMSTNGLVPSSLNQDSSLNTNPLVLTTSDTSQTVVVDNSTSVLDRITSQDVGVGRIEQIRRMAETKHVLPDDENSYYNKVHESKAQNVSEEKPVSPSTPSSSTSRPDTLTYSRSPRNRSPSNRSPNPSETFKHPEIPDTEFGLIVVGGPSNPPSPQPRKGKEIMSSENEEYYRNIQASPERNLLSLSKKLIKGNITSLMPADHQTYYQNVVQMADIARNFKKSAQEKEKLLETQDTESSTISRNMLAESAAQTFLANKPKDELKPSSSLPKSESYSNLPWDAPLQNARQTALASTSNIEPDQSNDHLEVSKDYRSRHRLSICDDDQFFSEKNGFIEEEDKYDLANRLEEEVAGSIIALWQRNLPSSAYTCPEVHYDDDDEAFEDDDHLRSPVFPVPQSSQVYPLCEPRLPPPPPSLEGLKIEIIERTGNDKVKVDLKKTKVETKVTPPQTDPQYNQTNGVLNRLSPSPVKEMSPSNGVAQHVVEDDLLQNLRSKLRKTKFDYESDTSIAPKPVEQTHQMDFRSVLKKGRFSGKWD